MNRYQHVRSLDDLSYVSRQSKHILTLFSGGVDSSYLLYKLSQTGCKVTALTVDLGDGVHAGDLRDIAGFFNVDLQIIDAREAFAHEFIIPAIRANAQYLGIYPISSSLSRPLIARLAVEQAEILGCDAILHTANQSQNSLRRLNGALHQLNFTGFTGSPYEYSALSREEKIQALAQEQIWVNEAIEGRWYSLLAASIAAFIRTSAETVSGTVTFNLRRGAADLVSIKARDPLYLTDRDGWEKQIARVRGSRNLADLSPFFTPNCSLTA